MVLCFLSRFVFRNYVRCLRLFVCIVIEIGWCRSYGWCIGLMVLYFSRFDVICGILLCLICVWCSILRLCLILRWWVFVRVVGLVGFIRCCLHWDGIVFVFVCLSWNCFRSFCVVPRCVVRIVDGRVFFHVFSGFFGTFVDFFVLDFIVSWIWCLGLRPRVFFGFFITF